MRIIIPIIGFAKSGGMRVLSGIADGMIKNGYDVIFICPKNNSVPYFPTRAKIITYNLKYSNIKYIRVIENLFMMWHKLNKVVCKNDVVLANHSFTAWPVAFTKKCRKYYYVQAYEPDFYSNFFAKTLSRLSYKLKLNIIVNAAYYAEQYDIFKGAPVLLAGVDLLNIVPNSTDSIENKYKSVISGDKELIIGCIGRDQEWKGTSVAIDSFLRFRNSNHNVKCKMKVAFFLPSKYEDIEGVINEQPHGDTNLINFYKSVDIFLAPGYLQLGALHYPILESLACGVPIIHCGYKPGDSNNSWIVSPKNITEIVNNIYHILNSYDKAIQKIKLGIETSKSYSWENVASNFIQIIKREEN